MLISFKFKLSHPYSEFFVQFSRFLIVEDYGCSYAIHFTWVSLVFFSIPPILLEFITGVYGCLSIRAFYNRSNKTHIINLNLDSIDI